MATFTDSKGHEWDVTITLGAAMRLKKETALDLDKISAQEGAALAEILYGSMSALAPVLWVLLRDQMEKAEVTADELADRFTPEVADKAGDALVMSISDFIHRRRSPAIKDRLRLMLAKVDEKIQKETGAALDLALSRSDLN